MKRIIVGLFAILLLSGCFETSFNFRTIVHRNGKIEREVQINGRGADRFLPPQGPRWEIKTAESQPGPSLLGDTQYHIHAKGHFADSNEFTSDFQYAVASLTANLTEEKRKELKEVLGIPEPFDQEIGTANHINLKRKRYLFSTEYSYEETFLIRHLIQILLHDLKKDALEAMTQAVPPSAEEVEKMAQQKALEEILPKFQFHSEVTLPGKIVNTNAAQIHGGTAIWDFRGSDFQDQFRHYTLQVTSKAPNIGFMVSLFAVILAVMGAFFFRRGKR